MSSDEPIRDVTLRVEPRHTPFLRRYFVTHRSGCLEDLAKHRDPERIRAGADTAGRVIAGLDRGEIVADPEVSELLAELAEANDEANEYGRACGEHEAFGHLLRQLDPDMPKAASGRDFRDVAPHIRRQQLLLLELIDPPAERVPERLADKLGWPLDDVQATAGALDAKGLAVVTPEGVAPSGCAAEFVRLWPAAV